MLPGILEGRTILVVQRRWLLALQVSAALSRKGARPLLANGADMDQLIAAGLDPSAAILDGNSSKLRSTLEARAVPYVLYTGYEQADDGCANNTVVRKPANSDEIVAAVEQLLRRRSGS
jgi:DNA-binding response OmpR family regulator